ncbi:MAG TPA: hypothetical protein PLA02_07925 [Brevefilum fermentans]|jgi:hypothetical protein|nr:hypothetical protein [Chloroflexota bacterium]HQA29127.1 hypothetical protein [Brevefilum fermentans]
MSRIIKTSTPGKEREHLSKAIVITVRNFMRQEKSDAETGDMVAFVILALHEIFIGIEQSVVAWEKRGYWVKADKYRTEWQWTAEKSSILLEAFEKLDWSLITTLLIEIMQKFSNLKVSDHHRMGKPWLGANLHLSKLKESINN